MKNKFTPNPIIIDHPPTPDADRIMKLVAFSFEALEFLQQTKAMYDEIFAEQPEGTPKGPAGLWVDKLVTAGLECFPPEPRDTTKEN